MTPSDIGPQYRSKLRESANFAVWSIKKTVKDNGARPAGSEQEKKAEEFVVSQVGAAADKSTTEEFGVSLKIDTMRYRVNFILLLLATAAGLAGIPIAAACIALAAYLFLICKPPLTRASAPLATVTPPARAPVQPVIVPPRNSTCALGPFTKMAPAVSAPPGSGV